MSYKDISTDGSARTQYFASTVHSLAPDVKTQNNHLRTGTWHIVETYFRGMKATTSTVGYRHRKCMPARSNQRRCCMKASQAVAAIAIIVLYIVATSCM